MTEVYLVTSGEYSDYSVDSVWSTQEAAQEYIDLHEKHNERFFGIDCAQIEVFTLNTKKPSLGFEAKCLLGSGEQIGTIESCVLGFGGALDRVESVVYNSSYGRQFGLVPEGDEDRFEFVRGQGKTPDAALKSARDYRAFVLAERGGVV